MTEHSIDPIIKAFEILSERISDLQDSVDLVRKTNTAKRAYRVPAVRQSGGVCF